ncbi:MAG: KamA family radical SAM protein [Spirochaetales bacterium]|nr:KamA family radical SAM protein [Spirochaetales bacterium]
MEAFSPTDAAVRRPIPSLGFPLTASERAFFARAGSARAFPFRATAFLLSCIDPADPADPIRRQIVPTEDELAARGYERDDPLDEGRFTVAPGLVRRYRDRCIFKATDACAVHCRFCFRKGLLGEAGFVAGKGEVREAARWLARRPEVREVLVTGGDPLVLPPARLEAIMSGLREFRPDVSLRIGTRLPAADPERITDELALLLARFRPLWITVHCNHPAELSAPVAAALGRIMSRGIRLGGQSVLLAGINDDAETLHALFKRQAEVGLRPYYLFHLDPAPGTSHFRVPLERGLELMEEVKTRFPRTAVPVYALDLPDGGGKAPVSSLRFERGADGSLRLRERSGSVCRYRPDEEAPRR